jgi:predicted MPP superfamily phosphohydrolase
MKTQKVISRRKFLKYILGTGFLVGIGIPVYSHYIERFWVDTNRITLRFSNLPQSFRKIKILHFSDVHLGYYFGIDDLTKLAAYMQQIQPDMICFTGDLVEKHLEQLQKSVPVLSKLTAPLGKYAILGNHDYWIDPNAVVRTLTDSGFTVLINSHAMIERDGDRIYVTGLDDILYGNPNMEKSLEGIPENVFNILLAHEPDFADHASQYPVQLQLSGHSHGGQIRIPFYGHLITPPMGSKYVDGINHVGDLTVYTNRGIGTTGVPYRFSCRPEVTVIELDHIN